MKPQDVAHKEGLYATVLNFSAGRQSSALLWMLIRGEINRPANLLVLNADPGMENTGTYQYVAYMREEAHKVGIEVVTVPGPNLYRDLIALKGSARTRLDNPAYWTLSPSGKVGRLPQKCTRHYKVAPMDRWLRIWLEENHGIGRTSKRLGEGTVVKWIGFGYDERSRVKPPRRKYIAFDYPLIRLGLTRTDINAYYARNNLPLPPPSVCNACFANTVGTFRDMHRERPTDWEQACRVDDSVRNWEQIGVHDDVYVSRTMKSLRSLPITGFPTNTAAIDARCNAGYCFL